MDFDGTEAESCFSKSASVVSSGNGHEILFSSARFNTFDTVFREQGTDKAMFRSLNPRLFSRRISRYLVIILTLLKMNLRISAHRFILIGSKGWLNNSGIVAHLKTEGWLTYAGQVAQSAPDYSAVLYAGYRDILQVIKISWKSYSNRV